MFCGKCGALISDKSIFCTECGAKMNDSAGSAANAGSNSAPTVHKQTAKAPEPIKNKPSSKLICPECGAKNKPLDMTCIQCGSDIDKSKLKIKCPMCKSVMNGDYGICPVCKWDIEHARWSSSEAQYEWNNGSSTTAPLSPANYNSYSGNSAHSSGGKIGIIVGLSIAVFLTAVFLFYMYKTENQQALELYNMAYNSLYDTDVTYISSTTKNMIDNAADQADSIFVSDKTKEKISKLRQEGLDYQRLAEVESLIQNNAGRNITAIKEKMDKISSQSAKNDERYTDILPYIKATEFKMENKKWADEKLAELKSDHSDTIQSWNRNHNIHYYTGAAYFISGDEEGMEIMLEDYDGNYQYLNIYYNYDEGSAWDKSLGELRHLLENNETPCVMAAIAAENYDDLDRIFLYSYRNK
jgi:RNA polymerase subunit RPABC4/transcription elongation factor Spt4